MKLSGISRSIRVWKHLEITNNSRRRKCKRARCYAWWYDDDNNSHKWQNSWTNQYKSSKQIGLRTNTAKVKFGVYLSGGTSLRGQCYRHISIKQQAGFCAVTQSLIDCLEIFLVITQWAFHTKHYTCHGGWESLKRPWTGQPSLTVTGVEVKRWHYGWISR